MWFETLFRILSNYIEYILISSLECYTTWIIKANISWGRKDTLHCIYAALLFLLPYPHCVSIYTTDNWNALSLLLRMTKIVLKFRHVAFVTEQSGWLWKYVIFVIYKTNFDSPYLMLLYTRHVEMTKPSGLTQLQARSLSIPFSLGQPPLSHTNLMKFIVMLWYLIRYQ
jgi:hypothetical protein